MTRSAAARRRGPRWELRVLDALAYPANLILGALAAALISLAVVTIVPAGVALARSFSQWAADDQDNVFTNTFRNLAATWRRTWPAGIVGAVVAVILVVDLVFMLGQLTSGDSTIGLVFTAAMVPVATVVCVYGLAFCTAAALVPDGTARTWAGAAVRIMLLYPLRSAGVLAVMVVTGLVCVLLPTLAPFIFMSVPMYAAVRLWPSSAVE